MNTTTIKNSTTTDTTIIKNSTTTDTMMIKNSIIIYTTTIKNSTTMHYEYYDSTRDCIYESTTIVHFAKTRVSGRNIILMLLRPGSHQLSVPHSRPLDAHQDEQ